MIDRASKVTRRIILTLLLSVMSSAGCPMPRGVSFQRLGIPEVSPSPTSAALVIGWEREDRGGWAIREVSIDDERRSEWDAESQRPAVIELEPGDHSVKLSMVLLDGASKARARVMKRLRTRPFEVSLEADSTVLCRIELGKSRPVPRCEPHDDAGPQNIKSPRPDRTALLQPFDEPVADPSVSEPTKSAPQLRYGLLDSPYREPESAEHRLGVIESRLLTLEKLMRQLVEERDREKNVPPHE